MSDTNAPEPTMEEILASIRRIISEDDPPASDAATATATPADPPRPAEEPDAHEAAHEPVHEDVLELTERVEPEPAPEPTPAAAAPPPSSLGDLDFAPAAAAGAAISAATPSEPSKPAPRPALRPAPKPREEPLVGGHAAERAADHFGALTSSVAMPATGRTLEDVTKELLRPLLKEWLDANLADIVEARVQAEVERISRSRSY